MTTRHHKFSRSIKNSSSPSKSKRTHAESHASSSPSSAIPRVGAVSRFLHATRSVKCLSKLHALLAVTGAVRDASVVAAAVERYLFFGKPASAAAVFAGFYRRRVEVYVLNIAVRCFSDHGFHRELLGLYREVCAFGSDNFTFPPVIRACAAVSCLRLGKEVHCKVVRTGHGGNVGVQTALLDMYAKSGQVDLSRRVFDGMKSRDLISWNAMISGYCLNGCLLEAAEALKQMQQDGFRPNASSLVGIVSMCSGLGVRDAGDSLHAFALKSGVLSDESLTPAFISMYAAFGHLSSSLSLFHQSLVDNLVSCNSMISACMQHGAWEKAFGVFNLMHCTGLVPNLVTVVSILPCCSNFFGINHGESVHGMVIKFGLAEQVSVVSSLVSMYSKLGDLDSAVFLFSSFTEKSQLLWNSLISGYLVNNKWNMVMGSVRRMRIDGVDPDALTVISVISSCRQTEDLHVGKSIHAYAVRSRLELNESVMNSLLAMYADCRQLSTCCKLFHKMEVRTLISWNTIISGFAENGDSVACLRFFCQMRLADMQFDLVTLIALISSLSAIEDIIVGESVHSLAIRSGCNLDVSVANALITMYTNLGNIQAGEKLFDSLFSVNTISYNALMTGYRKNDLFGEILPLFYHMIKNNQKPNIITLLNLLPICHSQLQGKTVHSYAIRNFSKLETSLFTSAICMYSRFNNLEYCHKLFRLVGERNNIVWNAILSACVQCKQAGVAFDYFRQIQFLNVKTDAVTILALISACSQLGNSDLAECVTAIALQKGFDGTIIVLNALVDMHSRCGSISFARKIFDSSMEKDSVSWSTMINAYSMHGDGGSAFDLFLMMVASGIKPDDITFVSVLSACSRSGFLKQGRTLFRSMLADHGITPRMEHYACMVDLLGRTGHLDEAYDIVTTMPFRPSESLLESLLAACRFHGNSKIGESVGKLLTESDHGNPRSYVMLSNIYASAGKWSDYERLRSDMEAKGLIKDVGVSLIGGTY
uniref:Pentacotripeptide-repeat region of PRORP domain-containing protein n=1 Tax=Oryza punctata TaxID=4537 RepID=A0A0E0LAY7_ORYPU